MTYDCLVIGGGPAGLTAAIYLARFHLSVIVLDHGQGRAASIPITHNHAGYPQGIAGRDLVRQMRLQAERYGAQFRVAEVTSLERNGDDFIAMADGELVAARAVLLATGVVNHRPPMPDDLHTEALQKGLIRYCPICDGFEITDKDVGVVGSGERALNEALFLRSFTSRVTMISTQDTHDLSREQFATLARHGIEVFLGPITEIELKENRIIVGLPGASMTFETIYPAMGSDIRSELAGALGAKRTEVGCVEVDRHQRTTIAGLYAAGDVVLGLDQISSAMGQASVAATTIRNDLCEQRMMLRA
ncbi:NAD(P)/FAD-dependent oxidoreductase [Aliirhizobium smilacinae]|uniref:Thioredoxin reductase n=1 Tax=Aliirhizobium smilacinae TaxID=1395944 RepID=A0A5C4XCZ8_9HYPH|nr:NAD(P)/FAD-dependent oxidoreductase [Rhizobium smilacinae]TNM60254.1 NAD(P)/FAD-dependent oxidoreductase [Rhizobium smilacinae]